MFDIIFFFLLLYFILIFLYSLGWGKIKKERNNTLNTIKKVSVLVAMRNEEKYVEKIINNFKSQNYPKDNVEFIIINDHSTDATYKYLKQYKLKNLKIINLEKGEYGKKTAINKGLHFATGEVIITTDADCWFNTEWVSTMVSFFNNGSVKLVAGPVSYTSKTSFFQKFQELEFYSLISSGAGAIGIGKPIFCNAANLAYSRDVIKIFNKVNDSKLASGDDVFLLHSVKKKYPDSIRFALDKNAIVTTEGKDNFSSFLGQRKRWAAKSTSYKDLMTIFVAILTFCVNLSFVFLLVYSIIKGDYNLLVIFYVTKFIADYLILAPALKFFNRKYLIKWIFIFEFFYCFYIILIVLLSLISPFKWKDRIYRK